MKKPNWLFTHRAWCAERKSDYFTWETGRPHSWVAVDEVTDTEPVTAHPPPYDETADRAAIATIVDTFFAAFTSGPDSRERLDALRALLLPEAVIVRTCGGEPTAYDVDGFIAPRQALLSGETLSGFREWRLSGRTEVFGDIGQHFCSYAKSWTQDGEAFAGRGMKTLQLVRTAAGWRISAAAWDDERDGLTLPP